MITVSRQNILSNTAFQVFHHYCRATMLTVAFYEIMAATRIWWRALLRWIHKITRKGKQYNVIFCLLLRVQCRGHMPWCRVLISKHSKNAINCLYYWTNVSWIFEPENIYICFKSRYEYYRMWTFTMYSASECITHMCVTLTFQIQ